MVRHHPARDGGVLPGRGLWHTLPTGGDRPSMRVGHTAVYIPGHADIEHGRVFLVGGADPSGPFCDTYVLNVDSCSWEKVECPGLKPRYEHSAFTFPSQPDRIFVFGGADMDRNMNDVQVLDVKTYLWSPVQVSGSPPSPRTHHTAACVGDKLLVYGGGLVGRHPVDDIQVHCFDAANQSWSVLESSGEAPAPCHGHSMAVVGQKMYLFGGMSDSTFCDDLHSLDVMKRVWVSVGKDRIWPCPRAAHAMVAHGSSILLFGGMNEDGALNDLYRLDVDLMAWSQIALLSSPPSSRLDFAAALITLKLPLPRCCDLSGCPDVVSQPTSGILKCAVSRRGDVESLHLTGPEQDVVSDNDDEARCDNCRHRNGHGSEPLTEERHRCETDEEARDLLQRSPGARTAVALLVHGGMDTEGNIFEDTVMYVLS